MESAKATHQKRPAPPAGVLDEIFRRVVKVHIALASATDNDQDVRRWSTRQLMDLVCYIEPLLEEEATKARGDAPATSPTS